MRRSSCTRCYRGSELSVPTSLTCLSTRLLPAAALTALLLIPACFVPVLPPSDNGNGNDNTNDNTSPPPGDSGLTGAFIGSDRCSLCHSRLHARWENTAHGQAFTALKAMGQERNAVCLPCHTVGFGQPGGFKDTSTTASLAAVGCEACHGPQREHAQNAADDTLFPKPDISAEVCGVCHTGTTQPHYDQWADSKHAEVTPLLATRFEAGMSLSTCGDCHSGEFFHLAVLEQQDVSDDELAGVPADQQNAVVCGTCHAPHDRTRNAVAPTDGRDYQLRFPEIASPTATNTIEAVTNAARFNLCGQCHHDRGTTWEDSARPPHPSNQSNVYVGEMPAPEGMAPLVLSRSSVHALFMPAQCATCHMHRSDPRSPIAPVLSEHTFAVNNSSCATAGCHPSVAAAESFRATLEAEIQAKLDCIAAALGEPATWEYESNGGPDAAGQQALPDTTRQARYLYYYVRGDGSLGLHNPDYVRNILERALALLNADCP
ncbi:Cytochrome c-554 precursor [Phycisphaerae bacterium RAS1]|nr:Cytochrome c-554 precursor [Phycisphaerae bacterium RAS1]